MNVDEQREIEERRNIDLLRSNIKKMALEMGLEVGMRKHLALVLGVHISTINNSINGNRSGPKSLGILKSAHKYVHGLQQYYISHATVNKNVSGSTH